VGGKERLEQCAGLASRERERERERNREKQRETEIGKNNF
jgi:hypothetical protein